jgi:hypothetical protein
MNDRDLSNYKFIAEILQSGGPDGLRNWYMDQPSDRQNYVMELLEKLPKQINNLHSQKSAKIINFPRKKT